MKDKNKQDAQSTFFSGLNRGIPFHNIFDSTWAFGLAILGFAKESFEEAVAAFEQLFLIEDIPKNLSSYTTPGSAILISVPEEGSFLSNHSFPLKMTPIAAGVLWGIYEIHQKDEKAQDLIQRYFPTLLKMHRALYKDREFQDDGLIVNVHPWETPHSQFSYWNSPMLKALSEASLTDSSDLKNNIDNYQIAYRLLEYLSRQKNSSLAETPFRIKDPLFHAFLSWGNESLIKLGGALGEDVQEVIDWYELTIYSISDQLWDSELKCYSPFDLITSRHLPVDILDSTQCLFSEVATQDLAEELYPQLEKRLKKEMQTKIKSTESHPITLGRRILLQLALSNYGFDELNVLLLQRLSFILRKEQKEEILSFNDFLIRGFHLFLFK